MVALLVLYAGVAQAATDPLFEFDENVMKSTVKIQSGGSVGTGFILLEPVGTNSSTGAFVLVTANHVLAGMQTTNATLWLRSKNSNAYERLAWEIPIRANGTNLWTSHPTADVAAMRIRMPLDAVIGRMATTVLADDIFLENFRIHPGDEVRVLGFPYGYEANNVGFPVLRSGRIASFPLTPTTNHQTMLIDFRVFPGNSGGPVYMSERRTLEAGSLDSVTIRGIIGLVSQEAKISETVTSLNEQSIRTYQLGLGVVVPARFILETISRLPPYSYSP